MKRKVVHAANLLDTSLRFKLLIAPAVLILALLLISGLAVNGLNIQAEVHNQINQVTREQIMLIDQFSLLSEQVQSDVYRIAVLRLMEQPSEEIQTVHSRLEKGVNDLKIMYGELSTTWTLDENEQAILINMEEPMNNFFLQSRQAVKMVDKNPAFGVLMVRSSALSYSRFRDSLDRFSDYQNDKIARTQVKLNQRTDILKIELAGLLLLMAIVGIYASLFISARLIARPIQDMTRIMSRLAENDLSIKLDNLERMDEIGAMTRAVEVFRNNAIEKARLDKELRESEARLLLAQEVAHIGNWELDLSTNEMWASEEAFRIYGLERNSPFLSLKQVQEMVIREDRLHMDAALNGLLNKQASYDEEFRIRRPGEETVRVIHSLARLVTDEKGISLKVVGVIQDITQRKTAEMDLRQSEEKFSKAFQTSPYAITITRAEDGKFIDVNQAFTSITGFTHAEALANSSIGLDLWVSQEDRAQVISALRSGQSVAGQEFQFRKKNGEIFTGLFSAQMILLNEVTCILSSINDITERKLAQEELERLTKDLKRSNTDLESFAYVVSHDLQEPLRMVTSYMGLLERRYKDKLDEDALEFINFAVDGSRRMKILITDLLSYSRVGTRGKEFVPTNIEDALKHALINLKIAVDESGTRVTYDPLPTLPADETQLVSLFQNLVGNAIKFHSDKKPEIHVGLKKDGNNWVFSVRDNGIGIDPKNFERIFVIFQRLHGRDEYTGTGIGLAICKRIVERHAGRIWIESEPGQGSTFYFTLPMIGGSSNG